MRKTLLIALIALGMTAAPAFAAKITVDVDGMVCDFCAQSLNKVFGEQESVEKIDISLDDQTVTVFTREGQNISDEKLNELIYYAGYDVRAIRRE